MTKYVPYIIIAVLIIGVVIFVSSKLRTTSDINSAKPSPIPVSQVKLEDESSAQAAIDSELNQIDKELSGIKDSNFDASGLSDDQLGL